MGVTGLWTVVQPCARPIKLETLNKKRLAVDASIWIYQFLKAVRDKEGNALRNSHVVGFFRRICKLLFFGIKPVFVFDGGAPILKRQTVSSRKARREGRRDDAVRTAGKLLAVQMQRRAEEEDQRRREQLDRARDDDQEEEIPENPVYVDELQMTAQERVQNRTFKKKDAYHLPNLDVDISNLGAPNDPRIMSHEELEAYARQFHSGEDVAMYDFSKIDFDSTFFTSLPASDRYNILNAARLRSRLRMGYSKEQLDTMFPNRMDFSRFQVDRVKERNELTQRLMNLNGMNEDAQFDQSARVAGEKGKEYVLVKNDGVEGGWALGVVTNKGEGEQHKPIDVEYLDRREKDLQDPDEEWEDEGFEDVPIEGLNRLPSHLKKPVKDTENLPFDSQEAALRRRRIYESRLERAGQSDKPPQRKNNVGDEDDLFVAQDEPSEDQASDLDELFEDVPPPAEVEEEDDLQRAIALSLQHDEGDDDTATDLPSFASAAVAGPRIDQPLQFGSKNAKVGRDFAHLTNTRAQNIAPKPFGDDSDGEEFDLQTGLAESRQSKRKPTTGPRVHGFKRPGTKATSSLQQAEESTNPNARTDASKSAFDGPLPFESINLGSSILGKKRKKAAPEAEGGFEKDGSDEQPKQPLPPWFAGDIRDDVAKQNVIEGQQDRAANPASRRTQPTDDHIFTRERSAEVIDLDGPQNSNDAVISIESSDEENPDEMIIGESRPVDKEVKMIDVADLVRAEPPVPAEEVTGAEPMIPAVTSNDAQDPVQSAKNGSDIDIGTGPLPAHDLRADVLVASDQEIDGNDKIDWSESEHEEDVQSKSSKPAESPRSELQRERQKQSEVRGDFSPAEQERSPTETAPRAASPETAIDNDRPREPVPLLKQESTADLPIFDGEDLDPEQTYSDPEDEDLMRQLAGEAEEHARFASSLNAKSYLQNAEEYERELRQLRNQQKKDRRDADEVTHIMITECQQLLRLFGLPYITAPMEAEAQCASLVSLGLVDGIVTDDSDCFLFGGTRIYKNFFNQSKFVECYLTSDLEKEYGLTREKLIRFAHLLGSDYTEGLPSVGPVTALEIISEFETLEKFAEWWSAVQMAELPASEDSGNPFRKKFRKNASKIFLPNTFPDTRVDHAYMHPEVDDDPQGFQWGVPNLDALRSFLMATIGWSQERTDEVLVPVIKDMNRREVEGTQANITQFFGGSVGVGARQQPRANENGNDPHFAPRRRADGKSSRMANALGRLQKRAHGSEADVDTADTGAQAKSSADAGRAKGSKERARKRPVVDEDQDDDRADEGNGADNDDDDDDDDDDDEDGDFARSKKAKRKVRKKGKTNN